MKFRKLLDNVNTYDLLALVAAICFLYSTAYNVYDVTIGKERYSVDGFSSLLSIVLLVLGTNSRKPKFNYINVATISMLFTTTMIVWFGLSMG